MHPLQEKLLQLSKFRDLSKLSYREIGRQLSGSDDSYKRINPQNIVYHIDRLIKAGTFNEDQRPQKHQISNIKNPINSAKPAIRLANIPIVGSANCGPADIFADGRIEGYLKISPTKLKSKNIQNLFALKASGDSMNSTNIGGDSINDGDFVIVDSTLRTPKDGERVVVVDEDLANIKRIYFDYSTQTVVLVSESTENFSPIYVDPKDNWEGLISGTVIQVIKTHNSSKSVSESYNVPVKIRSNSRKTLVNSL
jgi:SOS-response transcriptional repressor LexA